MSAQTGWNLPYRRSVGVALFNAEGLVWLGRRTDTDGAWQMPQGGFDKGESVLDCARRELAEETGVTSTAFLAETEHWLRYDYPVDLLASVRGGKYRGQEQKWVALRFTGSDDEINLNAHLPPEFSEWRWAPLASALDLIVPFKRPLYEQVIAAFSPLIDS